VNLDRLGETNLYPVEWKQIEYIGNKPVEIGSYTQIPLKLAWAITVHKSQGLSLDDVCLHVTSKMDRTMLYV
jgi:ATP-dependent exoDNAse (exonuclease V) alpha subunit